jgi:HAD domain in Swiss Army Knife RNA repair proteins
MTSPLLLLDIDGTLCPLSSGPETAMRQLSTGAGSVWFRADLPDVLTELAAHYELAWATAWHEHANLLLAPALGLPALPVVHFSAPAPDEVGSRYAGRTWKLPSIQRFGADRPLAWIDDDLHPDAYTWAAMRRIPTKLITTDPNRGITNQDVRTLLAFARRTIGWRSQTS